MNYSPFELTPDQKIIKENASRMYFQNIKNQNDIFIKKMGLVNERSTGIYDGSGLYDCPKNGLSYIIYSLSDKKPVEISRQQARELSSRSGK